MTTILLSPTAFKGTFSPEDAAGLISSAIKKKCPDWKIISCPIADGGDGTLEVLAKAFHAKIRYTRVQGPLGFPVRALWAIAKKTAVIEIANASGLKLIRGKNKILEATSYGSGQLIKAALDAGCTKILIGVGGTACSDGGTGALSALGLRYFDRNGIEQSSRPRDLNDISRVDWSGLDPRLRKTEIVVMCDVRNPLLGKNGSARTFGPQKGARPADVLFLESFLTKWSKLGRKKTAAKPGAGAAGGLGFGFSAFLGARLVRGSEFILKNVAWDRRRKSTDAIVTGEGKLDKTSFHGKAISAICRRPSSNLIYVICGSCTLSQTELRRAGIQHVVRIGKRGLKEPIPAFNRAAKKLVQQLSKDFSL